MDKLKTTESLSKELEKTKSELKKVKDELASTIEMQNKFIKDAIHEIHTPLSIIITNKDLVKLSYGNIKFLDSIEAACKVIQNSYEDMAYHVNMDRIEMNPIEIDLVEFVRSRCEYFESIAIANEIKLQLETKVDNFVINIPEIKLQRLVDNNISNAIKYANAGSIATISIDFGTKGLELRFSSFGRVIKDRKAVFARFHREDTIRGGYGIGLNLVYDICKSEKILINLTSSVKTGTIFCYSFKTRVLERKGG